MKGPPVALFDAGGGAHLNGAPPFRQHPNSATRGERWPKAKRVATGGIALTLARVMTEGQLDVASRQARERVELLERYNRRHVELDTRLDVDLTRQQQKAELEKSAGAPRSTFEAKFRDRAHAELEPMPQSWQSIRINPTADISSAVVGLVHASNSNVGCAIDQSCQANAHRPPTVWG